MHVRRVRVSLGVSEIAFAIPALRLSTPCRWLRVFLVRRRLPHCGWRRAMRWDISAADTGGVLRAVLAEDHHRRNHEGWNNCKDCNILCHIYLDMTNANASPAKPRHPFSCDRDYTGQVISDI